MPEILCFSSQNKLKKIFCREISKNLKKVRNFLKNLLTRSRVFSIIPTMHYGVILKVTHYDYSKEITSDDNSALKYNWRDR